MLASYNTTKPKKKKRKNDSGASLLDLIVYHRSPIGRLYACTLWRTTVEEDPHSVGAWDIIVKVKYNSTVWSGRDDAMKTEEKKPRKADSWETTLGRLRATAFLISSFDGDYIYSASDFSIFY